MNNLLESIPSTNVKIIEIYNKIESNSLVLSPDFQRKLVWKKQHKFHFIETILKNYPFPEIYIASSEMDVTKITSSEVVVDGQQRLSTIVDYIKGDGDFRIQKKVKAFNELSIDEKKIFLNYFVSVRDLKNMELDIIKDIFMRINNTEYSLNAVEKINAQYGDGEFIVYSKQLVDAEYNPTEDDTDSLANQDFRKLALEYFDEGNIFTENDVKRMSNLQFIMTLISTLIESEYFNRNVKVTDYIEKYNSSFDRKESIESAISNSLMIYQELDFDNGSYWFSKANSFTLLVEFSGVNASEYDLHLLKSQLEELDSLSKKYFARIELDQIASKTAKYFEFAKEAINAKGARLYRGQFIQEVLKSCNINI
jgi:Protein of unknown function DUF262